MKKVKRTVTSLLAATLLLGTSVQVTNAKSNEESHQERFYNLFSNNVKKINKSEERANRYSGEQLFKGLLFGQGPVSKLFPEIWTPEVLEKVNTKENIKSTGFIVKEMNKIDPSFFDSFKEKITSGNQLKIDEAMSEGAELFQKVLEKYNAEKKENLTDTAAGLCMVGYQVYTYALYVQIGGAVETFVAVAGVYVYAGTKFWGPSVEADSTLEKEMFVNTVAERLEV